MMEGCLSRPDDEFNTFFTTYKTWMAANGAVKGLSAGVLNDVADADMRWSADYPAHIAAQAAGHAPG